jgi:uncharacterized protein YciI
MQFLLIANDYPNSLEKRMSVRPEHLKKVEELINEKKIIYGIGLLDSNGNLCGSVILYDVDSKKELDEILKNEIYLTSKVWDQVQIYPAKIGPFWTR